MRTNSLWSNRFDWCPVTVTWPYRGINRRPRSGAEVASTFRTLRAVGALLILATTACDLPSEAPSWDTRWIVRADSTRIGIGELLPDRINLNDAGDLFSVQVDPTSLSWTLLELCPPCAGLDGQTVPKPPFQGSVSESADFPSDVVTIQVRSGSVVARVTNGFPFDPLRPTAGAFGMLTATLLDGAGRFLDSVVLSGTATAFPSGGTVTVPLDVGSVGVSDRFTVTISIDSPAGDAAMIDITDRLMVEVLPQIVLLESADVRIPTDSVTVDPVELGLEDMDEEVVDRVESGALLLDVRNPFQISVSLTLLISGSTFTPISKPIDVSPGQGDVRVELSGAELRSFLGAPDATFSGVGTVTTAAGVQRVTPLQGVDIIARLDLTLRIGG